MINHNSNLIEVVRNKSIPVADGLVFWYRYGTYESGSSTWNDAYFGNLNAQVVSSSFIQDSGSLGWDFNHTSSQAAYLNITTGSNEAYFPTGSYTFLLYGLLDTENRDGDPADSANVILSRDNEPWTSGWLWEYDTRRKEMQYFNLDNTSNQSRFSISAEVSSSLNLFACVVDVTNNSSSVFLNTQSIQDLATGSAIVPFSNGSSNPVWIGKKNHQLGAFSNGWTYGGTIKHTLLYNRVLSPEEQFQIYQFFKFNPYPLF